MKIALVTSLNEKLYHYYGHMFYTSFNWPFDTYVYHEGWMPSNPPREFIHRNIHETNPDLQKFLDRNNPKNVWSTEQKDPVKLFLVQTLKGTLVDLHIKFMQRLTLC